MSEHKKMVGPAAPPPHLRVTGIHKRFGGVHALRSVDFEVARGEVMALVGDNGAGKSTILDALTFGLFGRPFRSVNKAQLINSINRGGTVVEIEFSIGNKKYIVKLLIY